MNNQNLFVTRITEMVDEMEEIMWYIRQNTKSLLFRPCADIITKINTDIGNLISNETSDQIKDRITVKSWCDQYSIRIIIYRYDILNYYWSGNYDINILNFFINLYTEILEIFRQAKNVVEQAKKDVKEE